MIETKAIERFDERHQSLPATTPTMTPVDLISIAVQRGDDLAKIEKLMELQEHWEAGQAKKAYIKAMAAFKTNPPEILKQTKVSYSTNKGVTSYDHASLDHVATEINKSLSKYGLFASWSQDQTEGLIKVTCKICHEDGHSEETSLSAASDLSGGKNAIQGLGSTITYLQRYTILALTGLAAKGMDSDGVIPKEKTLLTDQQFADIQGLQKDAKISNAEFVKRLKKKFNITKASDLSTTQAEELIKALGAMKNA